MKIEYVKGDAFKTDAKYLLHGCNAQGVMGSGFAAGVAAIFPEARQAYLDRHAVSPLKVGEIIPYSYDHITVINGITQEFYGRDPDFLYASYDGIADVIREVNDMVKVSGETIQSIQPIPRVAMPKIGAGLANGTWEVIAKLIEEFSPDFQPVVYVID
jgi:O-acetyl-ADP-ribose deacetylase (regulator of RNase III)